MATYCFNLAAILAVSVMHSSSRVITRDQQAKICGHVNIRKTRRVALLYIPILCSGVCNRMSTGEVVSFQISS